MIIKFFKENLSNWFLIKSINQNYSFIFLWFLFKKFNYLVFNEIFEKKEKKFYIKMFYKNFIYSLFYETFVTKIQLFFIKFFIIKYFSKLFIKLLFEKFIDSFFFFIKLSFKKFNYIIFH